MNNNKTVPSSPRTSAKMMETTNGSVHEMRFNRMMSPQGAPLRLPNDDLNYGSSPVAKHAFRDGSFDETRMVGFNSTFHRKLKMRDSFTCIFPTYNHGERTTYDKNKSFMHGQHVYERNAIEGMPMHQINR
jgi:hypothetical protein